MTFTRLETPRLILRRLTINDLEPFVTYRSLPEVARFQTWEAFDTAQGKALIEHMQQREPGTPGEWFQFAIEHRDSGVLVGDCAFKVDGTEHRQAEIGFTLAPAHQGQGFATESVRGLLGYAFETLNLHRVMANCDARNTPSARVLERVGMRREAHHLEDFWCKGEWTSSFIYAILAREWLLKSF
jgi:RimJ/RimL family protein N-acetyltransferase